MRWPYDIMGVRTGDDYKNISDDKKKEAVKAFKNDYRLNDFELTGLPQDYKKRRVLVYNPDTQKAVVCAPAYFLWGETDPDGSGHIEAIVSPDAALHLGLLINKEGQINGPLENYPEDWKDADNNKKDGLLHQESSWDAIGMAETSLPNCMFTFVEDEVPLGIVTSTFNKASTFYSSATEANNTLTAAANKWVIGFGQFSVNEKYTGNDKITETEGTPIPYVYKTNPFSEAASVNGFTGIKQSYTYGYSEALKLLNKREFLNSMSGGGNFANYFGTLKSSNPSDLEKLSEKNLYDQRENTDMLKSVFDPIDPISVAARGFYDETFDAQVKVIAGNGRTLKYAQDIWNQFRWGYHTYNSVKNIFAELYGMDPDDDTVGNPLLDLLNQSKPNATIDEFGADNNSVAEFTTLLGADWINNDQGTAATQKQGAIGNAVIQYVDQGFDGFVTEGYEGRMIKYSDDKGIVDLFNKSIQARLDFLKDFVKTNIKILYEVQGTTTGDASGSGDSEQTDAQGQAATAAPIDNEKLAQEYLANIKTPKQLFLLLVGLFRQRLWSDPYSRAWLVLKPDRKRFVMGDDKDTDSWSFRPVDKVWQAFIDYNSVVAKDDAKWKKFLTANASEGTSSSNWWSGAVEDVDSFWDKNIGPIFSAFTSSLSSLANMFRMSMMQMGYGLSSANDSTRQANVLNKAYNDSLYYSLGRPGTLLRAVDNPFTREYGEPVVEVREPFQKVHYISSFTHIIGNGVQENLGGVATQITAVSDGQYPVTVALDKAAPAERQVEKTVETGIYFDNARGSGFFGILHPFFHPMETIRGITKAASGEPDELTARRVALAHLKESIKDIYQGEITIIGDANIRPHDIVYLADAYERMYGIFEVEQVVHHFTPEMGFVTMITPNAFVTVNDPARWFMSSWIAAHFSMQNLRNDTRLLMSSESRNTLVNSDGLISLDNLSQSLQPQMVGGLQYTHGHSALLKDVTANMAADSLPDIASQVKAQIKANTGRQDGSAGAAITMAVAMPLVTAGAAVLAAPLGPVGVGAVISAGAIASDLAWSAWKWTRDNVLDQHGCYVQYLNKNGQAMDAGLSFNQGMVVGRYASTKLLPTVFGTRVNTRTPEGYEYIRSDDLFRSMGWKEKEISDLVRYVSIENAIVNSEILKYAGIGPEKTGLNQFFRVIGYVTRVKDGDTFVFKDIINGLEMDIRFDGVNTAELYELGFNVRLNGTKEDFLDSNFWNSTLNEDYDPAKDNLHIYNPATIAGQAFRFTASAVTGRLLALRIAPNSIANGKALSEEDLEAGSAENKPENYTAAIKNETWTGADRYIATIFHKTESTELTKIKASVRKIFEDNISSGSNFETKVKEVLLSKIYPESIVNRYFEKIYTALYSLETLIPQFVSTGSTDPLINITDDQKKIYSTLVAVLEILKIYEKASEWPMAAWDEYYNDGSPITLNWDLVVNGLAKVYTKGLLLNTSPSVPDTASLIPMPTKVV